MRTAICLALSLASFLGAQEAKNLFVPSSAGPGTRIRANRIEREGTYPSTIRLSGSVEIRSAVCLPAGKDAKLICDGYTILRADSAVFHEDTGEIEASGSVRFTPLQHEPKAGKP